MCIHGETNREQEEDHSHSGEQHRKGKNNIFANAASVLSMAAEEISLDDHLERELANEVELWRMENSSSAVQKTAYGLGHHGGDSKGLTGISMISGAPDFMAPFAERSPRERSNSPPPRTQVSLHDRVGGGVPAAGRPASGTAETSPLPQRPGPSGSPEPSASGSSARDRHGSRTPLRVRRGAGPEEGKAAVQVAQGSRAVGEGDGAGGPPPAAEPAASDGSSGKAGCAAIVAAAVVGGPATAAAGVAAGGDAAAGPDAKPEAHPTPKREMGIWPRDRHASHDDTLDEGPPDPAADDREVDAYTSSDESTFVGFIEDPLEKERVDEHTSEDSGWAPLRRRR